MAVGTGPLATENQFPCRTLVACVVGLQCVPGSDGEGRHGLGAGIAVSREGFNSRPASPSQPALASIKRRIFGLQGTQTSEALSESRSHKANDVCDALCSPACVAMVSVRGNTSAPAHSLRRSIFWGSFFFIPKTTQNHATNLPLSTTAITEARGAGVARATPATARFGPVRPNRTAVPR